jgi:hypothetical protein
MPSPRRFPPPWTLNETNDACFIVRDATGQALGYFYFEDEAGRRSAAKLLTKDKARRMARPSEAGKGKGAAGNHPYGRFPIPPEKPRFTTPVRGFPFQL